MCCRKPAMQFGGIFTQNVCFAKRFSTSFKILQMKRTKASSAKGALSKKTKINECTSSSSVRDTPIVESSLKMPSAKPMYNNYEQFISHMQSHRNMSASNVLEFAFKKSRVRVLSNVSDVKMQCMGGIVYWMSRDARVQDNWALLFAQRLALKLELPLTVVFCLVPKFLNATLRHYMFLLGGLQEVEQHCRDLNISFQLLLGPPVECLPNFVLAEDIGAVVCDFAPLRVPRQWVADVIKALPDNVPLIQVDAHNIVPLWVTSEKQEYAARTIRNKINSKLCEYLSEFPPVIKHPHGNGLRNDTVDWSAAQSSLTCDRSVDVVEWAKPGYSAACRQLYEFCTSRLRLFNEKRNDPTANAISGLSPWLHFGQISAQRCALEVQRYASLYKTSVAAFCEEAIVRRELSDNFCYYNEHYDSLKGLHDWAYQTLQTHRNDIRSPCYTFEELEQSHTYDDLWNSAQLQLVNEGKIHGFLRMYWAKKILEWTVTPEKALENCILLNDKYSLDGRDPNGYVGCMWSIGGVHDQGWKERAIFGKIRFMNYDGCKRKFDVKAYVMRWGGKVYKKQDK